MIKNDPKNPALVSNLGYTLMESGDHASAEAEFRNALTIDPHYENAAVNLGLLLARQHRHQEALNVLTPVLGEAAAHHNLGVIAIDQGDESTAFQEFSIAASFPNAPNASKEFLVALTESRSSNQ